MPGCDVNLKWNSPPDNGCPLTLYTVYYSEDQFTNKDKSWHQINVTVDKTSMDLRSLKCNTEYLFKVSAWNELGEGDVSNKWSIKTRLRTDYSIGRILSIAVPVGCGFLIIITVGILCVRKGKKKAMRGHAKGRLGIM